jgi:riboflavin biosynthesis pyrimidine reductase
VDEYRFIVTPVIAGEARRLLHGANPPQRMELKLVESKTFESGTVALHYVKQ